MKSVLMGTCLCKEKETIPSSGIMEGRRPSTEPTPPPAPLLPRVYLQSSDTSKIIELFVLKVLQLMPTFIENEGDMALAMQNLHLLSDSQDGWKRVVKSIVSVIPLEDTCGPSAITIMLEECPLPSKQTVIELTQELGLSAQTAQSPDIDVRLNRNICVMLGCLAEKLAGPNSIAILTPDTLDFLITILTNCRHPCMVLFSLIALEKFAQTTENKLTIKAKLDNMARDPLLDLEKYVNNEDYELRQIGFCAQWALDNMFIVADRTLSYQCVDMTGINVILNSRDVSEYLKLRCDGLEARSDSYSFESVRCTFRVDDGCWYYECLIVTTGVMQIGWATKNSRFLNHDGFGIGDDLYSLSYDGCRRLIWYEAKSSKQEAPQWKAGDILGCLIDVPNKEIVFSLNGLCLPTCKELFETTRSGFFAAASFMGFQQCEFNFGHKPFRFPPTDRPFSSFNEKGSLTSDQKTVMPRRLYQAQLRVSPIPENNCTLCYDDIATCVLEPCGHSGFCSLCTYQLSECPFCRAEIINIRSET